MRINPVDGHFVENLVVFRGLQPGGFVAKGFAVEPPDLENADPGHHNRLQDHLCAILAALRPGLRLQVQWTVDSNYADELMAYADATRRLATNPWSLRQRDARFARCWRLMQERRLRRERCAFWFTAALDLDRVPKSGSREAFYRYVLDAYRQEFAQLGDLLEHTFASMGGRVRPMDDHEHFRQFWRLLNPAAAETRVDADALFADPDARESSIQDLCYSGEIAPLSPPDHGFFMDGYFHGLLVFRRLPKSTSPTIIYALTKLGFLDYSVTVNIRPLDVEKEIAQEEHEYKRLRGDHAADGQVKMLAAMQTKATKIARLMRGDSIPYQAQIILRAWDATQEGLRAKLTALKTAIGSMNRAQHYEPALPTSARNFFHSAWPGWPWSGYDTFFNYVEDRNLADLLPVSATPTGNLDGAEAIYDGSRGNLVGLR